MGDRTAAAIQTGKPADSNLVSRIGQGLRYAFSGKAPDDFFGPGQALIPVAQEQAHGRAFDFPFAVNIQTQARQDAVDFATLRALADAFDLVRLAIETRKDQMGKLQWQVARKDDGTQDDLALTIQDFLQEPDGEHDFGDWIRMLLEDVLVIDAPAVYIRPTIGGQPFAFEQIDGATIVRKIDARGRTPRPPLPGQTFDITTQAAYQQVIKGLPATDYHADELIYKPRNPRVHKIYGFSPVEQVILIVNIALRRQAHQLAFYTAGNIPDMLLGAPETWNPGQIEQFQKLWDELLAGDLGARRKAHIIPGGIKPYQLREATALFDLFDEWIARVVCYCFSLPPTAFVKQQNRATAETAQQAALEEGLAPLMEWTVSFINRLIRKAWKTSDYAFAWIDDSATDPLQQAQIDQIYTGGVTGQGKQIRTVEEIREDHGWGAPPKELVDANNPPPPPPPMIVHAAPGAAADGGVPPNKNGEQNKNDEANKNDESKIAEAEKLAKRRSRSRRSIGY